MRRLALVLCGSVPSLEEIRRFEARPKQERVKAWLDDLLSDRRCADYLAERFARAYVGTEDGPFLLYRRRRFIAWLSDALMANRPYDALVTDLIADRGLWTDHPATNFVSVTFDPEAGRPTPDRLAARVARAFLGARIDCAQCHDHPFQPWKQSDFRGLAAFLRRRPLQPAGHPRRRKRLHASRPQDETAGQGRAPRAVLPRTIAGKGVSPANSSPPGLSTRRNPNFSRATVNRVWALLFGRPLAEPIDDLRAAGELHPALSRLADDFGAQGYNLRRLIRIIAATQVFRLDTR